jgi:GNAT superfamily N-acetyltransferase
LIANVLSDHLDSEPGVAVILQGRLVGYMVSGFCFPFKGQQAAASPEYAHASEEEDKALIYPLMYMALAEKWISAGVHLHMIFHLAGDSVLKETLFQLGFGAILAERLRDFSPVGAAAEVEIVREQDYTRLIDLHREHMKYYKGSPIFILKDGDRKSVVADLEKYACNDEFLVYYENNEPSAYFVIGKSEQEQEGFLLRKTNTAQIKSAYAKPGTRNKGVGKTLLLQAVEWAKEYGYDRLFVEHETANYYGGNFWRQHFLPYMYVSMRYVDKNI